MDTLGILILAAGKASRFGADKLLAPMSDGTPLIAHALKPITNVAEKFNLSYQVIVRHDNAPLIQYLEKNGIPYSVCPNAQQGMGNSIAHGIKNNQDWLGWIIALADMPLIQENSFESVIRAAWLAPDKIHRPYVLTNNIKNFGHPVYFPKQYGYELSQLKDDIGAKSVLKKHSDNVNAISVSDEHILTDIDTQQALTDIMHDAF